MNYRTLLGVALLGAALSVPIRAAGDEPLRNWFDDPFFQVRSGAKDCPVPVGPFLTEAEMRIEGHHRAERGTSCWLRKECSKPSAYLYDPEIAAAVRSRFDSTRLFANASLWITVQHRFIWIEGCIAPKATPRMLKALVRGIPDVDLVVVNVTHRPEREVPYRALPDTTGPAKRPHE